MGQATYSYGGALTMCELWGRLPIPMGEGVNYGAGYLFLWWGVNYGAGFFPPCQKSNFLSISTSSGEERIH